MKYPYRYTNGAEVLGESASAIINHMLSANVVASLERYGLSDIKSDEWYPVDRFIDVFSEWYNDADNINTMDNLVSVGMAVVDNAPFPPDVADMTPLEQVSVIRLIYDRF